MGSSGIVAGVSSSGFINPICLLPLVVIGILAILLCKDERRIGDNVWSE